MYKRQWVDSMHSFYLGLNCYLCPEAVNAVKLMLAVEYVTSRVDVYKRQGVDGVHGADVESVVHGNEGRIMKWLRLP